MAVKPQQPLRYAQTWQILGWLLVAVIVWLSLTPKPPQPPSILGWDKSQHLLAYSTLMYWYGMSFAKHWRWPVFILALGATLEVLQGLSGFRSFDLYDIAANSLGVLLGLIVLATPASQLLTRVDSVLSCQLN